MSICSHNIIANSSLIWAAWLNSNKDKNYCCAKTMVLTQLK
jgi:hypothetical protein